MEGGFLPRNPQTRGAPPLVFATACELASRLPEFLDLLERFILGFRHEPPGEDGLRQRHDARKPKVIALPTRLNASGKNSTTTALATHCVSTGTAMAVPRIRFGKISGTSVQKTGPMQDAKNAR